MKIFVYLLIPYRVYRNRKVKFVFADKTMLIAYLGQTTYLFMFTVCVCVFVTNLQTNMQINDTFNFIAKIASTRIYTRKNMRMDKLFMNS